MNFIEPLSCMVSDGVAQLDVRKSTFCWRPNPVEGDGQETMSVLVDVRVILNRGAPSVWIEAMRLQKPAVRLKLPPLKGPPAVGWPMVPLRL